MDDMDIGGLQHCYMQRDGGQIISGLRGYGGKRD
jgi:hypothetical protein